MTRSTTEILIKQYWTLRYRHIRLFGMVLIIESYTLDTDWMDGWEVGVYVDALVCASEGVWLEGVAGEELCFCGGVWDGFAVVDGVGGGLETDELSDWCCGGHGGEEAIG